MENKINFVINSKLRNNTMKTIGFILSIITFSIAFYLFYDYFFENQYYRNRKILIKILKTKKFSLTKEKIKFFNNIIVYHLDKYEIWVHKNRNRISLLVNDKDYIGLFAKTTQAKNQHKEIINLLSKY